MAGNRIAAENGGKLPDNVKMLLIASPNTSTTGFFETPTACVTNHEGDGNQPTSLYQKGAHLMAYDTDFWANSGKKPITTQVSQLVGLLGDNHNVPTNADPQQKIIVKDGTVMRPVPMQKVQRQPFSVLSTNRLIFLLQGHG